MTNKFYIINNEIEFWPDKKLLRLVGSPESYYILNSPAAKCFELLLTHEGLVSHKELYDFAWEKEVFEPSPNTLYQNMSILRRGLRKIGVSNPDIIATVARKGFKLRELTEVIAMEESPTDFNEVISGAEVVEISEQGISVNKKHLLSKQALFISLSGVLFLLLLFYDYRVINYSRDPLADYAFVVKNDDCLFYANKEADPQVSAKLKINMFNCKNYPYNYITQFVTTSNFSVMACNFPLIEKNDRTLCKAMYFRGYSDE